ncbi:asparagine synthase (glutamine-hydrolyzing) [Aurantivibrio infirmus]
MCGIAGYISGRDAINTPQETAERMAFQLQHRGPDGAAYYSDSRALLVHTRLSIIDLSTGQQPIHNEDKTIWLTFNGEIFNYIELRDTLLSFGHRFYTKTDTEVIIHLYEQYGLEFVEHLNGQFSFCLWDTNKQQAVLVRDRVGIAPLFYSLTESGLWFGSEVKAILAGTQRSQEMNANALDQLLSFWAPVSPQSIFENIQEISPGEMAIYSNGELKKRTYWDLSFPAAGEYDSVSEQDAFTTVHDLLLDATKIRLRADVPVAAYLSGGLDSSAITSLIHNYSDAPLRTFSLTFDDADLDEQEHQKIMVDHLSTDHRSVRCSNRAVADNFASSIWHTEAPITRTAPVPMGLLSGLVRENNIKVVLTGEGADEVFGGYDIFKETKLRQFWSRNPSSEWRPLLVKRLYPYLQLSQGNTNKYLSNFFGAGVDNPSDPLFSHQTRIGTTSKVKNFLGEGFSHKINVDADSHLVKTLPKDFNTWSYFTKAQYLEIKTLMGGYLLNSQGDRMLMKNSVEGRFPFLDHRVIEYANTLHPKLKMKVLNEKYVLKQAMRQYLPSSTVKRYKQPYRAPMIPSFFNEGGSELVNYLLSDSKINEYAYFDSKRVGLLVKKIKAGRAVGNKDNMALVSILSTQCWHQQFIEDFSAHFNVDNRIPLQRMR